MPRPTIHDVARSAQVSLATVDRVLNNRGGVARKSTEKVLKAVSETGYIRDQAAANLSRKRAARFIALLPSGSSFLDVLRDGLRGETARLLADRIYFEDRTSKAFDVASQVAALRTIDPQETTCLALMATDAPEVRAEVARLMQAGVAIVTLVADLPESERACFVGIDNLAAGRTAGGFMGRLVPQGGPVLIIAGSLGARDHMERLMGFQQVLRDRYPGLIPLPVVEGYDDPERVRALVQDGLSQGLAGLYAIGAGTKGLLTGLAGHSGQHPVTILHELTPSAREGLRSGVFDLVIDQDPRRAARRAVTVMRDLAAGRPVAVKDGEIPFTIYIKENAI